MRTIMQTLRDRALRRSVQFGQRFTRDETGVTAIEFGMVGLPFFMLLFGIMGVGLYFFSVFNLENAVELAVRRLRTGEAQKDYALLDVDQTKVAFTATVCQQLAGFFDCPGKLRLQVVNVSLLQASNPGALPSIGRCVNVDPGTGVDSLVPVAETAYDAIGATQTIVVTACYELNLLQNIPFIKLGNMANGSMMLSASSAFRTEPY
jgi:TadE-like protein